MKNYDPNIQWGNHTVEITFQQWDYKGTIQVEMGGNISGYSVFESIDGDTIVDAYLDSTLKENNCEFFFSDDFFGMVLTDDEGEQLIIEEDFYGLEPMIVKMEIVDYVKEEAEE